jgi:hypothetical protein
MRLKKRSIPFVALIVGPLSWFAPNGAVAGDSGALQQLKDANTGTQSTGKTFDNSVRAQPSDAYPKGNVNVTSPSSGVSVSSGTAGGYNVQPSSPTATSGKKTGTESTKH